MGLGSATKKLQKVADMGEELYSRLNELRRQIHEVRRTVGETNERVATLENKVDGQQAILEALAEAEGIDVDEILTEVAIEDADANTDAGDEDEDEAAPASDSTGRQRTVPDAETDDRTERPDDSEGATDGA